MTRQLGLLTVLLLAACEGPANSLDGSISESFALDFDTVEIRKQDLSLLIEYLKDQSGGIKVCKVVIYTEGLPLEDGTKLDGDTFMDRVQLSRVAPSGGDFPPVANGSITFDEYSFQAGGKMSGEFDALFESTNGRQSTIHGEFDGVVRDVALD